MMFTDCLLLILPEHRIVFNLIGPDWILRIIGKSFLYVKGKVAQDVGVGVVDDGEDVSRRSSL